MCVLLGRRHCTRSQDAVGTHVGVRSRRTVASGATGRRITAIFALLTVVLTLSSQWGQRHVGRRHLAPSLGRLRRRHASHSPLAPVVYILLRHDCFFCCSNCVLQWGLYAARRGAGGDNANVKEWAHFIVSKPRSSFFSTPGFLMDKLRRLN